MDNISSGNMDTEFHPVRTRLKLIIALTALAALIVMTLTVKLPGSGYVVYELQNSGHALIFLAVSLLSITLLNAALPQTLIFRRLILYILVLGLGLGLGAGIEILQRHIGREASKYDLFLDFLGILAGILISLSYELKKRIRWVCRALAGILVLAAFTQPVLWWYAQIQRDKAFPLITDFDSYWTARFVEARFKGQVEFVTSPRGWNQNSTQVGKIIFSPRGRWPGISIRSVYQNWTEYTSLNFEIFSDQQTPVELEFRVDDEFHNNQADDRFQQRLIIKPGLNRFSIPIADIRDAPAERTLNLTRIQKLMWYYHRPKSINHVYIDNIYLK